MDLKNISFWFIGCSIVLFLLDFPLSGFLTTSRLGFLLLSLGLIFYFTDNNGINRLSPEFKPIVRTIGIIITAVFLSSLYNSVDLGSFFAWFFILLVVDLLARINNMNDYKDIIRVSAIFSLMFIFVVFIYCIINFGILAFNERVLRSSVNDLGPGLSRIVNGVVFANIILLIHFECSKTLKSKIYIMLGLIASYWFVISAQSRQGLLLTSLILIGFGLTMYPSFKYKKLALLLIGTLCIFILNGLLSSEIVQENFIDRTVNQIEDDEGSTAKRIYYYQRGLEIVNDKLFLGIGPGNFANLVGKDAHSGYMRIATETGIISIIATFYIFLSSLYRGLRSLILYKKFSFIIVISIIFIAPFFNSLYDSPMFWVTITLAFIMNKIVLNSPSRFPQLHGSGSFL